MAIKISRGAIAMFANIGCATLCTGATRFGISTFCKIGKTEAFCQVTECADIPST